MAAAKRADGPRAGGAVRERAGRVGVVALVLATALAPSACGDGGPEDVLVIEPPASTDVTVGDFVTLTVTSTGTVAGVTWSTSDDAVAAVVGGTVEARRPGVVTITASAPGALAGEVAMTVVERPGGYTADEVDYFTAIAFGAEFGTSSPLLRRWRAGSGPLIHLKGSPTAPDLLVLDSVIAEINRLAPLDIEIVTDFPTVEMHFVPQAQFQSVLSQAPPGNNGLVWVWWDGADYLFESVVLIATDTPQSLRDHVIREEVTQMLGLLQDSWWYPGSIFYQGVSNVTDYLPIDRVVIDLLYRPELSVGMTIQHAAQVARTLMRTSPLLAGRAPPRETGPDRRSVAPGWWWSEIDPGFASPRGMPRSAGSADPR